MNSDFSTLIERRGTNCEKWDGLAQVYGRDDLLPLWVADMDLPSPPEVTAAVRERAEHPVYGYTFRPDQYYQAFIDWLNNRHSWKIEREWVCDTPGVVPALALCVTTFTDPGDQVLIQTPVYRPFFQVVTRNGRNLIESSLVEEDGYYRMDYEDLEEKFARGVKLMILCSPHNPVGRVWTEPELTRLGDLCREYGVTLVSDEIWGDLVLPPHRFVSMAALPAYAEQTVALLAPSKTFNIAGLHNAAAVIPNPQLKREFDQALKRCFLTSGNIFALTAFTAAYQYGGPWLDEVLELLQSNFDLAVAALNGFHGIRVRQPEGTYLLWLDFRSLNIEHHKILQTLVDHGRIALSSGLSFGKEGSGFFRMNIGCPQSVVLNAVKRIQSSVENLVTYR
ncbi:MAG: MalY/PatB family protein [Candidatus Wallacebacter cryptica]